MMGGTNWVPESIGHGAFAPEKWELRGWENWNRIQETGLDDPRVQESISTMKVRLRVHILRYFDGNQVATNQCRWDKKMTINVWFRTGWERT